jgi:hypothetical protein
VDLFNQIRTKLVIFVHYKGFNISQKPKSSPLSYFAQKTSLNLAPNWYPIICTCPLRSDSCSYISNIDISLKRFWDCDFNFVNVLELHHSMENDKWYNKKSFDLAFHFSFNQNTLWTNWRSNMALSYNKPSILYQWK